MNWETKLAIPHAEICLEYKASYISYAEICLNQVQIQVLESGEFRVCEISVGDSFEFEKDEWRYQRLR